MDETEKYDRRTVLATTGAALGASIALAGCGSPDDGGGDGEAGDSGAGDGGGAGGEETPAGVEETETPAGMEETETPGGGNATDSGNATETTTDGGETETPTDGGGGSNQIMLGGATDGWQGMEPQEIADTTNPTLTMTAGETYEITWENVDGAPHNLIIADSNGNDIETSEDVQSEGESTTMSFTASEEMATYYCEYHPESMRGEVTIE